MVLLWNLQQTAAICYQWRIHIVARLARATPFRGYAANSDDRRESDYAVSEDALRPLAAHHAAAVCCRRLYFSMRKMTEKTPKWRVLMNN